MKRVLTCDPGRTETDTKRGKLGVRQNLLNQLLEPTFTSPDPRINLRQWNKKLRSTQQELVLHHMTCDSIFDVESSPFEHGDVAQEIEDYWDATEEFS